MIFQLSSLPISQDELRKDFQSAKAGAFASFEGWVRDHNDGKDVTSLEYEADDALCEAEIVTIFDEVIKKFGIIDAKCVHRTGKLEIGEMAVWIGVIAEHRNEAFGACRYLIDEIKKRLPIWKKEFYKNGESNWIGSKELNSSSL